MKTLSLSFVIALLAVGCASEQVDGAPGGTSADGGGGAAGVGGAPAGGSDSGGGSEGGSGPSCAQDCTTIETPSCYVAVCNEESGNCGIAQAEDGAACDDGLFCSVNDSCLAGECQAGAPYVCKGEPDGCVLLTCNEDLQACTGGPVPNGSPCTSANVCESNALCVNGNCQGAPTDCSGSPVPDCQASVCNPSNGQCEPQPDNSQNGSACSDGGDPCEVQKTCAAGACGNGVPKDCSALDIGCQNGTCNAVTGVCEGVPVPTGGQCNSGTNDCNTGTCNAAQQCVLTPVADGTACEDFSTCTTGNSCNAGTCGAIVSNCSVYLEEGFETCPPSGWTLGGVWECGAPTMVGPSAAHTGTDVIATNIDGNYPASCSYTVDFAQTPPIGLGLAEQPVLSYWHWIDTEGGSFDGYNVKVSTDGGSTFTVVTTVTPPYNLTSVNGQPAWGEETFANFWSPVTVDLGAYAGQEIIVRFSFRSDGSIQGPGVYIDDVQVGEAYAIPLAIDTASLPNAAVTSPYSTTLTRSGGSSSAEWSITGGTNIGWLSLDPATGQLSGTPSVADLGPVSITIRVEEPLAPSNFDEQTYSFNVQAPILEIGFEGACPNGWTLTNDWQCGVPTSGPGAAHGGSNVIATILAGNYNNNQTYAGTTATSPVLDLSATSAPTLRFWVWYVTELGFDGFNVKASSNGSTYTQLLNVTPVYNKTLASEQCWAGTSGGWVQYQADMSAFAGQQVNLRFAFRSDGSIVNPGVYIDDLTILD